MVDPLMPDLVIVDNNVPIERQRCILTKSKLAEELAHRNKTYKDKDLRNSVTAISGGTLFSYFSTVGWG